MDTQTFNKTRRNGETVKGLLVSLCLYVSLSLFFSLLFSLEVPLDLHGTAYFGKYLNSGTNRYYIDVSTDFYCTLLKYNELSLFIRYRDDLDVSGKPEGGVIFDPQQAHYYIVTGIDYLLAKFYVSGYFVHDCIHYFDRYIEGTPIFNRLKFSIGTSDFHYSSLLKTNKKLLWRTTLGWYPGWQYHNWSVNYGADYKADITLDLKYNFLKSKTFGLEFNTTFHFSKADSNFYHQHLVQLSGYYLNNITNAIGLGLTYNIFNNDPIKSPDKLWMLSIFFVF